MKEIKAIAIEQVEGMIEYLLTQQGLVYRECGMVNMKMTFTMQDGQAMLMVIQCHFLSNLFNRKEGVTFVIILKTIDVKKVSVVTTLTFFMSIPQSYAKLDYF